MAQADSVVPGGVQGLDRYAYVNNNPVNATDPSGHECNGLGHAYAYKQCELAWNGEGQYAKNWHGTKGTTTITTTTTTATLSIDEYCAKNAWDCEDNSSDSGGSGENRGSTAASCDPDNASVCYEGPIPNNLITQLEAAGVNPGLLSKVTLTIYVHGKDDPLPISPCHQGGYAGYTVGNTISFCTPSDFDFNRVNPTLVHELVHVKQYSEDGVDKFLFVYYILEANISYKQKTYEKPAYACSDINDPQNPVTSSYYAGAPLPNLSSAPCNLGG